MKNASCLFLVCVCPLVAVLACTAAPSGPPLGQGDAAVCNESACVSAHLVVGGAYRYQRVTPCASVLQRAYNKGLNETYSCTATLPVCGAVSVQVINEALADAQVRSALLATSSVFSDASRTGPWFQVLVGTMDWDGYFQPADAGLHQITVQTACTDPGCVPAPPGILRLAHVLEALGPLCEPK